MKPLTKYLNPKSQWHPDKEFPKEPIIDNIVVFLETIGFKEYDGAVNTDFFSNMSDVLDNCQNKTYIRTSTFICFHNYGPITKDNPVFFIRDKSRRKEFSFDGMFIVWYAPLNDKDQIGNLLNSYKYEQYKYFVDEIINSSIF